MLHVPQQPGRPSTQECSQKLGSQLDGELEFLVPMLLKKAGSASSGRDSFLAHHADLYVARLTTASCTRFSAFVSTTCSRLD